MNIRERNLFMMSPKYVFIFMEKLDVFYLLLLQNLKKCYIVQTQLI